MNQAGYTLVEMLVALTVIGLTVAGLTFASSQILRLQTGAVGQARAAAGAARLSTALTRLLDNEGPFASDADSGLVGDSSGFRFSCGAGTCAAELASGGAGAVLKVRGRDGADLVFPLGKERALAFEYVDAAGLHDSWPPTDGRGPEALRSVVLMRTRLGEEAPLVAGRIWKEQPAVCAFDPISRTCRSEAAP